MLVKIKDICNITMGQSPKSKYYSNTDGFPFLQGNRTFGLKYPFIDTYTTKITKKAKVGSILISVRAPVGDLNIANQEICIGRGIASLEAIDGDNEFLYYALKSNMNNILNKGNGTTYDSITVDALKEIEINIPNNKQSREKISKILSGIDNQIERNNAMTKRLQVLGNTIYSKEINKDMKYFDLKTVANISTGKEDANFASPNGKYNFYTCSEEISKCNEFAFDGNSILIAGNGNFNVKYYNGKFNAYQRTYVIQNDTLFGNIYYSSLRSVDGFTQNANGSIIKFITLGLVQDIQIPILSDKTNILLNDIVSQKNKIILDTEKLNQLKNTLLPLLINGQLEV